MLSVTPTNEFARLTLANSQEASAQEAETTWLLSLGDFLQDWSSKKKLESLGVEGYIYNRGSLQNMNLWWFFVHFCSLLFTVHLHPGWYFFQEHPGGWSGSIGHTFQQKHAVKLNVILKKSWISSLNSFPKCIDQDFFDKMHIHQINQSINQSINHQIYRDTNGASSAPSQASQKNHSQKGTAAFSSLCRLLMPVVLIELNIAGFLMMSLLQIFFLETFSISSGFLGNHQSCLLLGYRIQIASRGREKRGPSCQTRAQHQQVPSQPVRHVSALRTTLLAWYKGEKHSNSHPFETFWP